MNANILVNKQFHLLLAARQYVAGSWVNWGGGFPCHSVQSLHGWPALPCGKAPPDQSGYWGSLSTQGPMLVHLCFHLPCFLCFWHLQGDFWEIFLLQLKAWQPATTSSKSPKASALLQARGQLPRTVRNLYHPTALPPCSTDIHTQPEEGTISLAWTTTLCLLQPSLAFFKCHPSTWSFPTLEHTNGRGFFSSHSSPWGLSLARSQQHGGANLRSETGLLHSQL